MGPSFKKGNDTTWPIKACALKDKGLLGSKVKGLSSSPISSTWGSPIRPCLFIQKDTLLSSFCNPNCLSLFIGSPPTNSPIPEILRRLPTLLFAICKMEAVISSQLEFWRLEVLSLCPTGGGHYMILWSFPHYNCSSFQSSESYVSLSWI